METSIAANVRRNAGFTHCLTTLASRCTLRQWALPGAWVTLVLNCTLMVEKAVLIPLASLPLPAVAPNTIEAMGRKYSTRS